MCFVVGNRTVKGVQIPTDEIILELFQAKNHYKHHNTFIRNIPHKRMPKLNSPTNIVGNHGVTMNEEWIVIIEKNNQISSTLNTLGILFFKTLKPEPWSCFSFTCTCSIYANSYIINN